MRAAAKRSKDGPQARRLLALVAIYEGTTRSEAAKIGGVTLQIVRDWVVKFNARGPEGLIDLCQFTIAKQTLSRELRAMGNRKLSARPRHHAQAGGAIEDFKKNFPHAAGWHMLNRLIVPPNITIFPLPPKCPELNPVENIWQYMRDNWLSNRVFKSYDDILDHCCHAWNTLIDMPWKIMSIGLRDWAHGF